jgi:predicted TIM-barrel fold metal-dependent hydrolase
MYKQKRVIDVHGHMSTPPQFRAYGLNLVVIRNHLQKLVMSDEAMKPAITRHLGLLDSYGIDLQLLSPRPVAMMHWERPPVIDTWTRVTNDTIARQCEMHPTRFVGVGQLPQSPDGNILKCVDELERCVTELGFVGAILNPDPGGDRSAPGLNREHWFPLYERAEQLNATLVVHPSVTKDRRLDGIPSAYQFNNVVEETLATTLLENSDVFQRYPRLKVVVCHCGGAPRRLLEHGQLLDASKQPGAPGNEVLPSGQFAGGQFGMATEEEEVQDRPDLSNNLYFDTCAYDPHFLATAIKQRGPDRMVFGTEVPGSGSHLLNPETGRPIDDVLATIDHFDFLDDAAKLRMVHDNPLRAFPLLEKHHA